MKDGGYAESLKLDEELGEQDVHAGSGRGPGVREGLAKTVIMKTFLCLKVELLNKD